MLELVTGSSKASLEGSQASGHSIKVTESAPTISSSTSQYDAKRRDGKLDDYGIDEFGNYREVAALPVDAEGRLPPLTTVAQVRSHDTPISLQSKR